MTNVIMHAITSLETNIKWNGVRSNFFRPRWGILQGDPISHNMFMLCVDKLSHIISNAVDREEWKAIKVGRDGPVVFYLMFLDDLLLFGEATAK